MQKSPSKSTFVALILIVVFAGLVYFYQKGKANDDSVSSLQQNNTPESIVVKVEGDKVLSLLNEISLLQINSQIFTDPVYLSLRDYTISIPEQNVGRSNPFAATASIRSTTVKR